MLSGLSVIITDGNTTVEYDVFNLYRFFVRYLLFDTVLICSGLRYSSGIRKIDRSHFFEFVLNYCYFILAFYSKNCLRNSTLDRNEV